MIRCVPAPDMHSMWWRALATRLQTSMLSPLVGYASLVSPACLATLGRANQRLINARKRSQPMKQGERLRVTGQVLLVKQR